MARTRQLRALRGVIAAAIATFTALLGHVAGGGSVPGWLGIVAPLVLSAAASVLLVGARLSLWRLGVVVAVSQTLFHTLFVLGTPTTGVGGGHHHGAITLPMAAPGAPAAGFDPAMTLGHAFAAVVTIAALYRGEVAVRALLRLAALLASAVRTALSRIPGAFAPLAALAPPRATIDRTVLPLRGRVVVVAPRRGPPALAN